MFTIIFCKTCCRQDCPEDCLLQFLSSKERQHKKLVAYVDEEAVGRLSSETAYRCQIGTIEITPYTLAMRAKTYRLVRFGRELSPGISKNDIDNYVKRYITDDFWMALNTSY